MGRHPTGNRKYEVTRIQDNHREIIRRLALGQKPTEIARDLGLTPQQVSNVRNSAIVQRQIALMQGQRDASAVDVVKHIQEMAPTALAVLEEAMAGEDTPMALRIRAAVDVLDRGGYSAPKRVSVLHGHLTSKDIAELKRRAENAGVVIGKVVEVDDD